MPLPRIAPEELERLKTDVSVQRLAEARGIKLKPHGKNLIGLCPFHEDHEPSLVITPGKNLWNCLGACGTGGTVIDWVMKAEGVSFRHAVEILREGAIPQGPLSGKVAKIATVPKLPSPVSLDTEDRELMNQVVNYYHETLKKTPEGLSYLEKRGLTNSEMIDHFKIGYANRTLGLRLPDSNRKDGAAIRARLRKVGLYRDTGREHFCGAIVFPVFNEAGEVTEIYGRKTTHKLTPGLAYHVYLPGPHKGVFNLQGLNSSKEVILCEAIIDALTFWCAGFRNVTASYGANGFTPDHLEAFKKAGIERVYIAYDCDKAGDKAAYELSKKLMGEDFECFRVHFPHGMDANAYALKIKPATKAFELVIRNAEWLGKNRKEPTTATKGKNISEAPQSPGNCFQPPIPEGASSIEADNPGLLSRSSNQPTEIFPLAAEKSPEPARTAPVSKPLPFLPEKPVGDETPPLPQPSAFGPETEIKPEEIIIRLSDRRWRVRGLGKNMSYDQLKVNLLVSLFERFYIDTFDLYSARCRAVFTKQVSEELRIKEDIVKIDLGRVLLKLEELQDKQIKETLEPKEKPVVLTPEETAEALELLKDPRLLHRILSDFEKCGIVGEETNKLVGYLAAVSRKLEKPLAIIIQSSSSAGKTLLMESILAFMPDEERIKYSAMTGQSLFYMGEKNLQHKILAIVEEEGAERASYALKLLQSEGELSIASTGKDPQTGRLVTHEYKVQGPVMIFIATTNVDVDEELRNRCIMLTVDESSEQTRAIHQMQRESRTLEGFLKRSEKPRLLKVHKNAQRLIKPIPVLNLYARFLTFMVDKTRLRRDHEKYLSLIETITLIYQHQRPLKTIEQWGNSVQCLEVSLDDIELANRLAHEVLGRSLDELPPQTRRFLILLDEMVLKECKEKTLERHEYRFYRSDLIQKIGWSYEQIRVHLERLIEREYVLAHFGGRGQRFMYELIYDGKGKDGKPFLPGLIDVEALRRGAAPKKYSPTTISTLGGLEGSLLDSKGSLGGPLGGHWGGFVGPLLGKEKPDGEKVSGQKTEISEKNARIRIPPQAESYTQGRYSEVFPLAAKNEKGNGGAAFRGAAIRSESPLRGVV